MTGPQHGSAEPSSGAPPPAPEVDETAIAAAKSKVGAAAKATVASVQSLAERATNLLAAPARLRESARQQTAVLHSKQVEKDLRDKPVSSLRDMVGRGARLGPLADAGYGSVADVAAAPRHRLQAVPGLGPQSVEQVSVAAQRVKEQVAKETNFRLDPDRRDPGQTQLLATPAATRHTDGAVASLQESLRQFTEQTTPLIEDAARAGSRTRMLLRGRKKKRAALAALAQLDAILADPRVVSLQQTIEREEHAVDPTSYTADLDLGVL